MKSLFYSFIAIILMTVFQASLFAEDLFYYHHGVKIPLTISPEKICVKFTSPVTSAQVQAIIGNELDLDLSQVSALAGEENLLAIGLKRQTDVAVLLQRLQNKREIAIANPVYLVRGIEAIPTDRFIVKLRSSVNLADLDALNQLHNVEIVTELSNPASNRYTLRISTASDSSVLTLAQLYYEKLTAAAWSTPDFIMPVKRSGIPNDTHFPKQYYFNNSNDVDIDAPEAWDLNTGSSSIYHSCD